MTWLTVQAVLGVEPQFTAGRCFVYLALELSLMLIPQMAYDRGFTPAGCKTRYRVVTIGVWTRCSLL